MVVTLSFSSNDFLLFRAFVDKFVKRYSDGDFEEDKCLVSSFLCSRFVYLSDICCVKFSLTPGECFKIDNGFIVFYAFSDETMHTLANFVDFDLPIFDGCVSAVEYGE